MATTVLDNCTLWIGDGTQTQGHLVVRDGVIESVDKGRSAGSESAVDLQGMCVSPGLIDLMVLGGFDRSILRDDPLDIAKAYLPLGVTNF